MKINGGRELPLRLTPDTFRIESLNHWINESMTSGRDGVRSVRGEAEWSLGKGRRVSKRELRAG